MSEAVNNLFKVPFNNDTMRRLRGHIKARGTNLAVAATANSNLAHHGCLFVTEPGQIQDVYSITNVVAGAGESIVIDIEKSSDGGATWATVLSATTTIDSTTTAKRQVQHKVDPTKRAVVPGDMLRAKHTYTAGGTPAPLANISTMAEIG